MSIVVDADIQAYFEVNGFSTSGAATTAFLALIRPAVEAAVKRFLTYDPEQATHVEFHPELNPKPLYGESDFVNSYDKIGSYIAQVNRGGRVNSVLQLKHIPVRTITSVYENVVAFTTGNPEGDFPAASLLPASYYRLDISESQLSWTGHLFRNYGNWLGEARTVKVTYVSGLTALELASSKYSSIKLATLVAIAHHWSGQLQRLQTLKNNGMLTEAKFPGIAGAWKAYEQTTDLLPAECRQMLQPFRSYSGLFGR